MYIPKWFKNEDIEAVKSLIQDNSFALLISEVDGRPWATHLPLLLKKNEAGNDVLVGHVSKANSQWESFSNCKEVLAVFSGVHAYISSSWYDHENVPTWNYVAVHVYGTIRIIEGNELKLRLSQLVDKFEANVPSPMRVENLSKEFYEREVRGIVGFELLITEIQAASKLSQNRDEKNLRRIIAGLDEAGDSNSVLMAKKLRDNQVTG